MGTMSEKDIRVQEHIDEFLTRVAARWEEGCDTDRWELGADPGEKAGPPGRCPGNRRRHLIRRHYIRTSTQSV